LNEGTRLGLTYLSQVKLDFEDTPEFTGLGPLTEEALRRAGILGARLDLGMTVPQTLMASAYHELSENWAIMGNVGWQNWNEFGKTRVSIADTLLSTTIDLDYKDTWHGALGVEWGVAPAWLLMGGIAYDSSPIEKENLTLALPMGETWRFGVGGQWAANERVKLGFAYELGWIGNLPVDEYRQIGSVIVRRVSGEYENSVLHMFALNLTWNV
jgi:long-chain fatty acid transport protein